MFQTSPAPAGTETASINTKPSSPPAETADVSASGEGTSVVQNVQIDELEKVTALDCWPEVLEKLEKLNPPLRGALVNSTAYISGDLCLIHAPDETNQTFLSLIRNNSFAKNSLREALKLLTGQKYRLGPYSKEKYQIVDKLDPLDAILNNAAAMGIAVEIKE